MMRCTFCKLDKSLTDFPPSAPNYTDTRYHWCRECNTRRAAIRKHGVTPEQKAEIAAARGGCAICGHPDPSGKGWVVDHDRLTCCPGDKSCPKCRRGVVCGWCNSMLGYAFDRVETLRRAIAYLEAQRSCDWHMPVACAPGICTGEVSA